VGAASLYPLNTASLRVIETVLFAVSMIGGEEAGCLAMATKPNKNLNSSHSNFVATRMAHFETHYPIMFKQP